MSYSESWSADFIFFLLLIKGLATFSLKYVHKKEILENLPIIKAVLMLYFSPLLCLLFINYFQ